jgi:hypothetical protein
MQLWGIKNRMGMTLLGILLVGNFADAMVSNISTINHAAICKVSGLLALGTSDIEIEEDFTGSSAALLATNSKVFAWLCFGETGSQISRRPIWQMKARDSSGEETISKLADV